MMEGDYNAKQDAVGQRLADAVREVGRDGRPEDDAHVHLTLRSGDSIKHTQMGGVAMSFWCRLFQRTPQVLPLPIERLIDEPNCTVDIDATPDQLDAMLSRIRAAWQSIGETEPYYSVLATEAYRSGNFDKHRDRFYASGLIDVKRALAFLSRNGIDPSSIHHVLDYGCGVGRLTVALAHRFPAVTGIDISDAHLCHAKRHASDQGIKNVDFVRMVDLKQLDLVKGIDFVFSLIVLQHNPPPIIAFTLRKLFGALNDGGCALFQVPTFFHGFSFSAARYLSEQHSPMEINAIPQRVVFDILRESGCHLLEIREDGAPGLASTVSHTFLVQKAR
jgi:SAM-dependent methyltransferase